ncbi:hypothetical protein OESDEN_05653 [Oesophagostomum dentatum]|uniref:Uncharacterized protein n=1 Tax=Oesophagostomum dentatum TaxID=61180 RepID=A0A0B1TAX7_OESDE|nr:hypothetical protein OESDEN_05653 [Oesophagostomum dentatum]
MILENYLWRKMSNPREASSLHFSGWSNFTKKTLSLHCCSQVRHCFGHC